MKENYTKPMLSVELFSLTQTVARDCSSTGLPTDQLTLGDPATCYWDLGGGMKIFVANSQCTIDGENMGYGCYHNPSEGNYVFRS